MTRTCTAWSLTSAISAHQCTNRAARGGLCAAHLAYPDRASLPKATDATKEKR